MIEIVFETHSASEDNEAGRATGWLPGRLSERGRTQAHALGDRRRRDGIVAVFCSDLARAVETAQTAFGGTSPCCLTGGCGSAITDRAMGCPRRNCGAGRRAHVDLPYPAGESWRQAITRAGAILDDLAPRWRGRRVLIVGHGATRWSLEHFVRGVPLEELVAEDSAWQPGWNTASASPVRHFPPDLGSQVTHESRGSQWDWRLPYRERDAESTRPENL